MFRKYDFVHLCRVHMFTYAHDTSVLLYHDRYVETVLRTY